MSQLRAPSPSVFESIGCLVDLKIESKDDLARASEKGLTSLISSRVIEQMKLPKSLFFSPAPLFAPDQVVSDRDASERLFRVLFVYFEAKRLFENDVDVMKWMGSPMQININSPPVKPIELACFTDEGRDLLVDRIRRTVFGMF
jgi:hypothetical protein